MKIQNNHVQEEILSSEKIFNVNKQIARELIEQRLDIPATQEHVEHLALCIMEMEVDYEREAQRVYSI